MAVTGRDRGRTAWHLDLEPLPPAVAPVLDEQQQAVVDHRHGALLVLAGPGTGKTTTIVEAIVARLTDPVEPIAPDQVLALTFGKRAASDLRDRLVGRLGGGVLPAVATFHSFAFGLLQQTATAQDYREPPQLLSGAEEDVRIRELLMGAVEDGTIDWPDDLAGAVSTIGLANEVRAVLAKAKVLGITPEHLERLGLESQRPAWAAVGRLAAQEADVMEWQNVLDYVELLSAAVARAHSEHVAPTLQQQYRLICVDEYQDTDPLQVELLRALVGPNTTVIAVGDPDQSIYGFRGADLGGILRFPEEFGSANAPAPIVVLRHTRRFGPEIRDAATRIIDKVRLPHIDPQLLATHRNPECEGESTSDAIRVEAFDSDLMRSAGIAAQMRTMHLHQGVPWSQMAVLVRNSQDIAGIQRALVQAGVPAAIATDEIPLRAEPAIAVLLRALEVAVRPSQVTTADALELVNGPLCGVDPTRLRALGRALRLQARKDDPTITPAPADELLRDVLRGTRTLPDDEKLADINATLQQFMKLMSDAHAMIELGAAPAEVLWLLWSGQCADRTRAHGWPDRLRRQALDGSRSADHDVDAVMALFDAAERAQQRYRGVVGVRNFVLSLQEQHLAAEPVSERGVHGDVVRVLTAHRAKGQEWDAVWIAGTQEGQWPDLRPRGSVLESDRLTPQGVGPAMSASALLAEERRLMYVALTRARHQCVITTLQVAEDSGTQPSRFLNELDVPWVQPDRRPRYTTSLAALVGQLRATATDSQRSPAIRQAALRKLAELSHVADDEGDALVPAAETTRWWGMREVSHRDTPIRDAAKPVHLSGSAIDSIEGCPLKWFLEHDVHAEVPRGEATKFGSVIHAVADYVAKGEVPDDLDAADAFVDRVWRDLRFEAPWQSEAERAIAREAIARFLNYHLAASRTLIATEGEYTAVIEVPTPDGGSAVVQLRGFIDRVEQDSDGKYLPIDLKNMKKPPGEKEIPEHAQLGVYQLLLREAGYEVGGAALVQLRADEKGSAEFPKVQKQEALPEESPTWIELKLGDAAQILRDEAFDARENDLCQFCAYRTSCPTQKQGKQVLS